MTEEEFKEQQGDTLHIRLLMYYNQYTNTTERDNQKDTDQLVFSFPDGDYVITYLDLKSKADEETLAFTNKYDVILDNKPLTDVIQPINDNNIEDGDVSKTIDNGDVQTDK